MSNALRDRLTTASRSMAAHPGLLLQRYLTVPVSSGGSADGSEHPAARAELLLDAIRASVKAEPIYKLAFNRWKESFVTDITSTGRSAIAPFKVATQGRFVTGLGDASPIETGLRLHHTYGVPCLPGSALKGLAAHYCDCVWGNRDPEEPSRETHVGPDGKEVAVTSEELGFRRCRPLRAPSPDGSDRGYPGDDPERVGRYHKTLFGTTESAGMITFHDAWIAPESLKSDGKSGLVRDIMTPHHKDYYGGERSTGKLAAPTDFDDPNPISFLSITGSFWIGLSCDAEHDNGALTLARQLVLEALRHWGLGGKTSSGYGRIM